MLRAIYNQFFPPQVRSIEPSAAAAPAVESSSCLTEKEQRIQLAYREGFFTPFREGLLPGYWGLLEKIGRGVSIQNDPKKMNILYLFALLKDPLSTEIAKQAAIEEYCSSFAEEERENFFHKLKSGLPECIAVAIIQYAPLDIFQEICQLSLKYRSVTCFEEGPGNWFKEVFTNPGLYPDAAPFLDRIFSFYPKADQKELACYLFLHNDAKERQMLFNALSPALRATIDTFIQEVEEFLTASLDSPTSEGLVDIPFQGRQREYFSRLFFQRALDHPESFRIVAGWDDKEWKYFKAYGNGARATTLALKWMHQMAQFVSAKEKEGPALHESAIWLFFMHASGILPKRLSEAQRLEAKNILQSFSPLSLAEYYNAFNHETVIKPILKELAPSQIVELFSLYITHQKTPKEPLQETLADMWSTLQNAYDLESLCRICFLQTVPLFGLTIFSSLPEYHSLEALTAMAQDQAQASQMFADWYMLGLSPEADPEADPEANMELIPSVKLFLSHELRNLLAQADPSFSVLLKAELQRRQVDAQSLACLFPEAGTPEQRQEQALEQLEALLSREDIDDDKLGSLIGNLRKDLQADEELTTWMPKLFERLPKQMWPLLFCYFARDLCIRRYDMYSEEKTRCGMFKQARGQFVTDSWKNKLPKYTRGALNYLEATAQIESSNLPLFTPKWLPDPEKWIDLAAHTLVEVVDNPLLEQSQTGSALQSLYQAMCETKTIDQVISHFCIIAPAHTWIPALEILQRSAFYYNEDAFYNFIAEQVSCLNFRQLDEMSEDMQTTSASRDKVDFIAERFAAQRVGNRLSNLRSKLFEKPFIQTPEEASDLVDALIRREGIGFLGYFVNRSVNTPALVEGVKARPNGGKSTFLDWFHALAKAEDENGLKISILESMGADYAEKNPEEFIAFLQEPEFAIVAEEMYVWYAAEADKLAGMVQFSQIGCELLMHFNPDAFYPTVFAKLSHLQQKGEWFDIGRLFSNLPNMPGLEELAKRLLTDDSLSDFRNAFQQHVKEEGVHSVISSYMTYSAIGQALLFQLCPDWSSELIQSASQTLQKEHDQAISYGDSEGPSSYYQLTSLYESLDRAGVLSTWLSSFEEALAENMKPAFRASKLAYEQRVAAEKG